jgi:hypothetical protein
LGLAIGCQGPHLLAQRASLPFVFDFANARLAITVSVAMNFTFALLPVVCVVLRPNTSGFLSFFLISSRLAV